MRRFLTAMNLRREAITIALVAAEVCWVAPVFLVLIHRTSEHPPGLVWLAMLGLYYTRILQPSKTFVAVLSTLTVTPPPPIAAMDPPQ